LSTTNDAAGAGIRIAPIEAGHAEGFHACLDAVARERRFLGQIEAPPLERVRGFVRDSVASAVPQWVALDGERVVGWCDVFPHWAAALCHTGRLGMGVLATHRGRGIGRRLLAACVTAARAQGISRIELEARADNAAAIALYESAGFAHEALKRRAMRFDGVYFAAVQMSWVDDAAA